MADFYWAPSGHPFRVELRFTTSASPSQEGSALFATDFPRYTRSRWTKKDRDRLGDRFVDESSRCVVPGELLQPLQGGQRMQCFKDIAIPHDGSDARALVTLAIRNSYIPRQPCSPIAPSYPSKIKSPSPGTANSLLMSLVQLH